MNIKSGTATDSNIQVVSILESDLALIKPEFQGVSEKLFDGKKDASYWLEQDGNLVCLVGLGDGKSPKAIQNSFRRLLSKNADKFDTDCSLRFLGNLNESQISNALIGFELGAYHADFYRNERKNQFENLDVKVEAEGQNLDSLIDRSRLITQSLVEGMRLVDLPPSVKTPEYLADWALKLHGKNDVTVKVLDEKQAKEEGLEAFLSVGRGSSKASKFIIIDYQPEGASRHIGLVGKGVTFDTGGYNIKTQGMHHMKSDMGGAAAVLAGTKLISDLKLQVRVTTIVPAVENAVSRDAFLPSEVISSYSGLSIEVIDTDAEGRLILADGLSYLQKNYSPEMLLDFATLTGSSVGTFGYACGALFSKNEELSRKLQDAGGESEDKLWPLPLWDEYGKEMDSDIADIKNYHGKPIAGAITAAKFLEAFTDEHPAWAHMDIAGVAYGDSEFSKSKTGTAFGVQLLLNFIENELNHGQ
mgnify:CR=1 FL=1